MFDSRRKLCDSRRRRQKRKMTWTWPNSLIEFRVCSGEIPPCSFETTRRLLWRNTNNELLPVYDRQLCEWYLKPQILRCECLGDNKWFLISLISEFVTQIWGKSTAFPQIWVTNSDLSDELKFEWNRLVSPRFEWTLKFERSPRIEGITYFWGWSSTCLTLIPAWISNHMPSKLQGEITYPFLNFNGCTVEV